MRSLAAPIEEDLKRKFVFLTGPRQVGKTYLAQEILKKLKGSYYSWDLAEDRQAILTKGFIDDRTIVLDELHKYARWKNFIKGIYDKYHERLQVLVTGSARLDIYRRGGDSLMGRYFLHHLHPLTMGEISRPERIPEPEEARAISGLPGERALFEQLMRYGGFPEPFYVASDSAHNRWSLQRRELLVREEIRDLTNISLLSVVEHLFMLLPGRVGSVLSVNSLKEDLQVSYNTVRNWLDAFQKLYISFQLRTFAARLQRSIHKEQKLYLWDWSQVQDEGNRFENLVAGHLLKAVHTWRDLGRGDFELWFLRDRDRREVDFCITKSLEPWLLVETKLAETNLSESLDAFSNRLRTPAIQVVAATGINRKAGAIPIVSADRWLPQLP